MIQVSVGKAPRVRPTQKMWKESTDALYDVLNSLDPEIIIIPGKALMANTLNKFESTEIYNDGKLSHHLIKHNGKTIKTFAFNHPAGALSYSVRDKLLELGF